MNFNDKLLSAARKNKSWLCIGLDTDLSKLPSHFGKGPEAIFEFNKIIIENTSDLVCAYKPNSAFYESIGPDGLKILKDTIDIIPDDIPVILDSKRGDIGNTAAMYAKAAFDYYGVDAVTANPYLGGDSIEPFLKYSDKGIFVLCLTSNPSSVDIQKRLVLLDDPPSIENLSPKSKAKTPAEFFSFSMSPVYMLIATLAKEWNKKNNVGLVVGATAPRELEDLRKLIGENIPILIPGVGVQGGDLEQAVSAGSNSSGELAVVNVSRAIIYSDKTKSFRDSVRGKAEHYRKAISLAIQKKAEN